MSYGEEGHTETITPTGLIPSLPLSMIIILCMNILLTGLMSARKARVQSMKSLICVSVIISFPSYGLCYTPQPFTNQCRSMLRAGGIGFLHCQYLVAEIPDQPQAGQGGECAEEEKICPADHLNGIAGGR